MPARSPTPVGTVYLVGAGPGDPGLITLRGVECLRRADLVLYDYLANPRLLDFAPPEARRVCLGRHGRAAILPQQEVNRTMVDAALAGKTVVRLKGGDPAVFARAAEELEALTAAGVPCEVVPGITAALAVGSHAGIPLTHRDHASAVALVTGHEGGDKPVSSLDFAALARFPGTLVFYMGVTSASHWTQALVAAGLSPETPAAIVRRCSWPDQMTIRCTLGSVAPTIARHHLRPPVVVIIGQVAALTTTVDWFTSRPLFGRRILVTRPLDQADELQRRLLELGADVLVQPAIQITAPADWQPVDRALARLEQFDWLVFSSVNGVRWLLHRLLDQGSDLRSLAGVRLAAIGPGTARALEQFHLRADLVPRDFRAEALAEALSPDAAGKRFLLARASRGREVLAEQLRAAGGIVEQIVVYQSVDVTTVDLDVAQRMASGRIDWVTVTSSAIARSLATLFGESLTQTRLASISPVTSATLRQLRLEPTAEAATYTVEGVVDAILAAERRAVPAG